MIKNNFWVFVALAFCLPIQAEFMRFLGGTEWDYARDALMNSSGQVVVVGDTWSHDFPAQGYRSLRSGSDGFLSVLDKSGQVLASHFVAGGGRDEVKAVVPMGETHFYWLEIPIRWIFHCGERFSRNTRGIGMCLLWRGL